MDHNTPWILRHSRTLQWIFLALNGALLLYALGDALAVWPGDRGWRPRASVVMSLGMLLQPTAALMGKKRPRLQSGLLVLSVALMVGSLRMQD